MKAMLLTAGRFNEWVASMMNDARVVGPVKAGDMTMFSGIKSPDELVLGNTIARKSPKGAFFPQSEVILKFKTEGGKAEVEDVTNFAPPTVLLGVHPCDAASMEILDKVFCSRYKDKFYVERRENTTVVSLACDDLIDSDCFCTSVGLAPDSRKGSDIYMETSDSGFYLEILTDKGEALIAKTPELFEPAAERKPREWPTDNLPFDVDLVKTWLDNNFDHEMWKELSLRCGGCGTCAFVCPVCHCFDIVDEARGPEGVRRKNWDSCQFGMFTKHASGHNPRDAQGARYRQRIMHKFKYYVDNFESTLCVGCGRCVRSCPVGQSLLQVLADITREAKTEVAR